MTWKKKHQTFSFSLIDLAFWFFFVLFFCFVFFLSFFCYFFFFFSIFLSFFLFFYFLKYFFFFLVIFIFFILVFIFLDSWQIILLYCKNNLIFDTRNSIDFCKSRLKQSTWLNRSNLKDYGNLNDEKITFCRVDKKSSWICFGFHVTKNSYHLCFLGFFKVQTNYSAGRSFP